MANKVLFLTGLFPTEIREEIIKNSKNNTQYAADGLQWSLVEGLTAYYKDIKVLNFPYIGSYPTLYSTTSIKQFAFGKELGFDGFNVGYFNFLGLKNFDIYSKAKKRIFDWARQNNEDKTILIYNPFVPFLKAAIAAKRKFKNIKIAVIITDLPQHMGGPDNVFYRIFKKYNNAILEKSLNEVDKYVLITKYMAEMLPIGDKKWTVVEGVANLGKTEAPPKNSTGNKKIIHYTGSLHRKSGILNLIEAFNLLDNNNYQLEICGSGNTKDEIIAAAGRNGNIVYKGNKIDRPGILKLQRDASLLVSPRTPEGEFTKFSFPSKVMEFLASGTPTLLYKLAGIPDEYYDYCYTLEDTSVKVLADKISEILNFDPEVLIEKGRTARDFVLKNKNPEKQSEKIYKLIEEID
ncbi:MAG: glycosyltransferase [Bacteroidetes bacterium]|jgi:glycosyltransferase involved in cell wall biosynthesis|nr:glycosyltransferase [Bacteroidota bacterium]